MTRQSRAQADFGVCSGHQMDTGVTPPSLPNCQPSSLPTLSNLPKISMPSYYPCSHEFTIVPDFSPCLIYKPLCLILSNLNAVLPSPAPAASAIRKPRPFIQLQPAPWSLPCAYCSPPIFVLPTCSPQKSLVLSKPKSITTFLSTPDLRPFF